MKKLLTILMLCIISLGYSQEFLGIKVDGSLYETVAKFKAKGFRVSETGKNMIALTGTVQLKELTVLIVSSPKTYKVWKFIVYLPERSSWYTLKGEYKDYVNIFKNKYGNPSAESTFEYFQDPYYEGDGYEMQAVRSEKVTYSTYWIYDTVAYSVKIDKLECVTLSYENRVNYIIHKKETDEQNYSTF